ncbi:unnamed protein product [Heterotrigona itama]|uniref:Uncharacterized protein n=1 Tax=Heterotrigona itama TaxID=395501 RepID=A0A6V7H5X2_9HYME|nr:unnamed protein product [Heterotrigona itama]
MVLAADRKRRNFMERRRLERRIVTQRRLQGIFGGISFLCIRGHRCVERGRAINNAKAANFELAANERHVIPHNSESLIEVEKLDLKSPRHLILQLDPTIKVLERLKYEEQRKIYNTTIERSHLNL